MKLHFLPGGRLRMRRSIYVPGAAKDETIELPVHSALVRHKQANLLFDTGCSPQAATDPERRWAGLARVMTPIFKAEETVVEQLSTTGLTANDIDIVVCSHLHPDHCGCNEHFRRATIFCHEAELEAARAEGAEQQGYLPQDWNQPQGFRTFNNQHDVFGDGRFVLVPMPGHTPGSTVARVGLDRDGTFVLASDTAPLQSTIETGIPPKNTWNMNLATDALVELKRRRDIGEVIVSGHDDEQWKHLRKTTEFYE